jgi:transcriptional regulator with XRE-family HTH domain
MHLRNISQPEFGRRLKRLRDHAGLKQADLAGGPVSPSYVSRLESGTRLPSRETIAHLAQVLQVPVEQLTETDGSEAEIPCGAALVAAHIALADEDYARVVELLEGESTEYEPLCEWQACWLLSLAYRELRKTDRQAEYLRRLTDFKGADVTADVQVRLFAELAGVERSLGNLAESLAAARRAVSLLQTSSTGRPELAVRAALALLASETEAGLAAEASERVPALLAQAEKVSARLRAQALWAAAGVYTRCGLGERGMGLLEQALTELDSRDDLLAWARLRVAAASLSLRARPSVTPRLDVWLDEAESALRFVGHQAHKAELGAVRARVYLLAERYREALECAQAALDSGTLAHHDRARTELVHTSALIGLGEVTSGRDVFRRVAVESEAAGFLDLAAEAWKALATTPPDGRA